MVLVLSFCGHCYGTTAPRCGLHCLWTLVLRMVTTLRVGSGFTYIPFIHPPPDWFHCRTFAYRLRTRFSSGLVAVLPLDCHLVCHHAPYNGLRSPYAQYAPRVCLLRARCCLYRLVCCRTLRCLPGPRSDFRIPHTRSCTVYVRRLPRSSRCVLCTFGFASWLLLCLFLRFPRLDLVARVYGCGCGLRFTVYVVIY